MSQTNNSSIYNVPLGNKVSREDMLKKSSFYSSSFKQLNSMQSKQVGLIMGACVADAALRGLEELSAEDIQKLIDKNDAYETSVLREAMKEKAAKAAAAAAEAGAAPIPSSSSPDALPAYQSYDPIKRPNGFSLMDPLVFSGGAGRKKPTRRHMGQQAGDVADGLISGPMREELLATRAAHSYSYLFFKEYLRAVAYHHHAVGLSKVEQQWGAIERLFPEDHSVWHGSAPHVVASMAAVPANYPWAADDNLRAYTMPFAEFLSTSNLIQKEAADAGASAEPLLLDPHVIPQSLSALSLPLRCLAHNPDPVRYNALQAMPFSNDVFPRHHADLVPGATLLEEASSVSAAHTNGGNAAVASSSAAAVATLAPAVHHHQQTLRTAMHIVDRARTYTEGVLMCSRAATHAYPHAWRGAAPARALGPIAFGPLGMLVGAALGAKFAVKSIPVEWLSATSDHEVVGTQAIQLAEWSWNTPSRLKR